MFNEKEWCEARKKAKLEKEQEEVKKVKKTTTKSSTDPKEEDPNTGG